MSLQKFKVFLINQKTYLMPWSLLWPVSHTVCHRVVVTLLAVIVEIKSLGKYLHNLKDLCDCPKSLCSWGGWGGKIKKHIFSSMDRIIYEQYLIYLNLCPIKSKVLHEKAFSTNNISDTRQIFLLAIDASSMWQKSFQSILYSSLIAFELPCHLDNQYHALISTMVSASL